MFLDNRMLELLKIFAMMSVVICFIYIDAPHKAEAADKEYTIVTTEGIGDTEESAVMNARKRAVMRMIVQLSSSGTAESIIGDINPLDFTSDLEIKYKNRDKDSIVVVCNVQVDDRSLAAVVKSKISNERQLDPATRTACCIVRTNSSLDQETIQSAFSAAAQELGMDVSTNDGLYVKSRAVAGLPHDEYETMARTEVEHDPSIAIAVIGDVHVEEKKGEIADLDDDRYGKAAICNAHFIIVDAVSGKDVSEFTQSYEVRRASIQEAHKLAVQKCAVISAKNFVDAIMKYWKEAK